MLEGRRIIAVAVRKVGAAAAAEIVAGVTYNPKLLKIKTEENKREKE